MSAAAVSPLEQLAAHGHAGFPHLLAARKRTDAELQRVRERLGGIQLADNLAIVLFGSWGRRELTQHSDDDWLLLVAGDDPPPHLDAKVAEVGELLGVGGRRPGRREIFGVASFGASLAENIGLDDDDNRNLTQRMLLMLESVPVAGDGPYRRCWDTILDRYLAETRGDFRPPRFFLNDVIRYWRTIAVDFAGKHRDDDRKWGLRNAKLRTARKMLFAGGLLPVLRCHAMPRDGTRAFLAGQLERPASDRVADAFLSTGEIDSGVRCLGAYDRWLGLLEDAAVRDELTVLDRESAQQSAVFAEVRRVASEFESGLLALLFETPLAPAVRQYAIF